MAFVSPFAAAEMTGNGNRFSDFLTVFIICFSLQILFDLRKRMNPIHARYQTALRPDAHK